MCACQSTYKNSFTKIPNYVMLRGKSNSKIVDPVSERTPISVILWFGRQKKNFCETVISEFYRTDDGDRAD